MSLSVQNDTQSAARIYALPFLLPECFFNGPVLEKMTTIRFEGVLIIRGNETYEDPVVRVMKMAPFAEVFSLSTCLLFWSNGSRYEGPNDWTTSIFANAPSNLIGLTLTQLGMKSRMPLPPLPPLLRYLNLSRNALSGTLSPSLFASRSSLPGYKSSSAIDVSHNRLTGSLPSSLFDGLPTSTALYAIFSDNLLEGTIDPLASFISSSNLTGINTLVFCVDRNRLSGSIPPSMLARTALPTENLRYITVDYSHNAFTGGVPEGLVSATLPSTSPSFPFLSLSLSFQNNSLAGPLSMSSFFSSMVPTSSIASLNFDLNVGGNALSGTLNTSLPSALTSFALDASRNNFETLIFDASSATSPTYFTKLDVSDNENLEGSLSPSLFLNASRLAYLNASYTSIDGILPDIALYGGSSLRTIALDYTDLDLCGDNSHGPRLAWDSSSLSYCSLIDSPALRCPHLYPSICNLVAPTSSGPSSGPSSSSSTPSASSCPPPAPSADFYCIDGHWASNTSVSTPTLLIPPGSGTVIVNGNVTSNSVIIQDIYSIVVIYGCFNNLSTITVRMTPDMLRKLATNPAPTPLLYYNGTNSNCSDLSQVQVLPEVIGSSCRTVKVDKVTSSGMLSAVFSVSSSRCNLWWIILVSVLGGVIIIAALALVIVFQVAPKLNSRNGPSFRVQT